MPIRGRGMPMSLYLPEPVGSGALLTSWPTNPLGCLNGPVPDVATTVLTIY